MSCGQSKGFNSYADHFLVYCTALTSLFLCVSRLLPKWHTRSTLKFTSSLNKYFWTISDNVFSSLLKSSIFAFRVMNHDAIQWWDFKKNVFVQIVNCAFPCPWHVWGAILMNTFCSIQYALWLSSSKASRALTCQKSHLLPWLQNEQYYFAPHIHYASFLLLLRWTVPSSALSPGPSLISQGGGCLEEGTFTK